MTNLQDLLLSELRDLYHAESQLVKALPRMAKAASNPDLREAYKNHAETTKMQVERLRQVFEQMGQKAKGQPCEGMQGLIQEGEERMQEAEGALKDVGMLGASERIEQYEISGYESAIMIARMMGLNQVADLLQETLREEEQTAKRLHSFAKPILKEATKGAAQPQVERVRVQARKRPSRAAGEQAMGRTQAGGPQAGRSNSSRKAGR